MKKTHKHLGNARRGRGLLAGAGLVLTGAALAASVAAVLPGSLGEARAATHNFVKSANPDAVTSVLLDEEISINFSESVLPSSIGPDTVLVRTGLNFGEQARGVYLVGAFMYDRSVQRRAVIRPEAIREYYELVRNLPRADAERAAQKLIQRIEKTGKLALLRDVDLKLRDPLVEGSLAGTRLDSEDVYAIYPAQLADSNPGDNDDPLTYDAGDSPFEPYRTRIAGDDTLWQTFLAGDVNAFGVLTANPEFERFYHDLDPSTGVPAATSVLRQREHRRVLINRKNSRRVMFVPEIPIRADLTDTGFQAGKPYQLIIPGAQPGIFNTVLSRKDRRPILRSGGKDFTTWFNTVPATATTLFRTGEARTGISSLQKPRVVNITPPNGETFVDATTDWEDPDNLFNVALAQRKTFSIRIRFAQALDPRTVSPTTFTVTKIATLDSAGNDVSAVNVPIAVGTFLNQHRLGIVEVEVTPAVNLDVQSRYKVEVKNLVASLGGQTQAVGFESTFTVGAGAAPLEAIRVDFTTPLDKANPADPDTLNQFTTGYWPAPALYDLNASGKLVAAFMPFAGTGVGAPSDPRNPGSPTITSLALAPGQSISFLTENVNPLDPATLGTQIEYNYVDVSLQNAAANAVGRYPLVVRSQNSIVMTSSDLLVNGQAGGDGSTNTDTSGGGPTGGLGGNPGVGGFRGGDGGNAPTLDQNGQPEIDPNSPNGNFKFDQTKYNGLDGFPSFLTSTSFGYTVTGGGSGGFSGDREAPYATVNCDINQPAGQYQDRACNPAAYRESGGGGGHATAGGAGDGAQGSGKTKTGGYRGGVGGATYGRNDFGDQKANALFGTLGAPRLGFGTGGAGGGGGGAEDGLGTTANSTADAADSGGGGGGGGGGALQFVARTAITIDSSVIDASGGRGGRTFNAARSDYGLGAPGGCGAGGSIWFQCYGDITIQNGSKVTAAGGSPVDTNGNPVSAGYIQVLSVPGADPGTPRLGKGGVGGDGYIRFEDSDGAAVVIGSTVTPTASEIAFRPYDNPSTSAVEDDYQAFPGIPLVVNKSQGFSRWFDTRLDTPSFAPFDDDPGTAAVDGTSIFYGPDAGALGPGSLAFKSIVDVWVRSAPNDTSNNGHPNLFLATSSGNKTPWTRYVDVGTISRKKYLQFRVDFEVPLSFDWDIRKLPYIDYFRVNINLN